MEPEDIEHQANEIITGQLRQVIASMSIDEINADREKFESQVRNGSELELNKIAIIRQIWLFFYQYSFNSSFS